MIKNIVSFVKQVVTEFTEDEAMARAATVAFYAALSLAPMVLLFIAITGYLGEGTQQRMIETVTRTVGEDAGQSIETIAAEGENPAGKAGLSFVVGISLILFSASGVVAAFQSGLNSIWDVRVKPGGGIIAWIRHRLLSIAMVLTIGFLLLVSMVATTVIGMVLPTSGWIWNLVTLVVTFGVFTLLFAAMFKILPDVDIPWRHVWVGAIVTAALFAVGKYAIGLFIARAGYAGSYGAAGSIVALLVWVYYSALLVYLGAEITQVYAKRTGEAIQPSRHATHIKEVRVTDEPAPAQ